MGADIGFGDEAVRLAGEQERGKGDDVAGFRSSFKSSVRMKGAV